jgi:hypothetical protein
MFHPNRHTEDANGATAMPDGDRVAFASDFAVSSMPVARISSLDVRSLPNGSRVVVKTRNSRYRLVIKERNGGNAVIDGGRYFGNPTEVRVDGSTLGGSSLEVGWIVVGLYLEFSVQGHRILTSRVRSITVEPATC